MVFGTYTTNIKILRTSKPKIKLQKGVQYGAFKIFLNVFISVIAKQIFFFRNSIYLKYFAV